MNVHSINIIVPMDIDAKICRVPIGNQILGNQIIIIHLIIDVYVKEIVVQDIKLIQLLKLVQVNKNQKFYARNSFSFFLDIDECEQDIDECRPGYTCKNIPGTYK